MAAGLAAAVRDRGTRRLLLVSGTGAGVLSITQWAVAVVLVGGAADREASGSAGMLAVVDRLDVVKLLLLACLVGIAGRRTPLVPAWWRILSSGTSALLVVGAVGLLVPVALLEAGLALSLLALLAWAGALAVLGGRTTDDDPSSGSTRPLGADRVSTAIDREMLSFRGRSHRLVTGVPAVARELR
jgi:hypothetical protein